MRVVVAAFADYPYWCWLEPDADARAEIMRAYYTVDLAPLTEWSHAVEAPGGLAGVAIWTRSDEVSPFEAESTSYAGPAADRMRHALAAMARLAPNEQHWYLDVLAIDPAAQGRGLGGSLLDPGLDRAAGDGLGCYLETAREANVRFYKRHGFAVTGEVDVSSDAERRAPLHVWGMWRPPGGSAPDDRL